MFDSQKKYKRATKWLENNIPQYSNSQVIKDFLIVFEDQFGVPIENLKTDHNLLNDLKLDETEPQELCMALAEAEICYLHQDFIKKYMNFEDLIELVNQSKCEL